MKKHNQSDILKINNILKPRKIDSHKGDYGHALIIAGEKTKMGAALISATACLRSGAGLVTVSVPTEERFVLQSSVPEAMLVLRDKKVEWLKYDALGIGPAMGTDATAASLLEDALSSFTKPTIIDADAITILAAHPVLMEKIRAGTIFTPHPKEFDRLFGEHENNGQRRESAIDFTRKTNTVIILKGYRSLIISGEREYVNLTGNAGLAKGGSGDALTGMITAFLAQGYDPLDAACLAAHLHGMAADLCLKKQSMESMLITDVIQNFGVAFKVMQKRTKG